MKSLIRSKHLCTSFNVRLFGLRLESPTRSLLMEAPKGIQILAEAGDIQAICRNELRLESKDGEVGDYKRLDQWCPNLLQRGIHLM